jgi:hypothetical protein
MLRLHAPGLVADHRFTNPGQASCRGSPESRRRSATTFGLALVSRVVIRASCQSSMSHCFFHAFPDGSHLAWQCLKPALSKRYQLTCLVPYPSMVVPDSPLEEHRIALHDETMEKSVGSGVPQPSNCESAWTCVIGGEGEIYLNAVRAVYSIPISGKEIKKKG